MEFVSAITGPIVSSLTDPVKKQLDYFFSSTKYVMNMNTRLKQLDGKSCDVKDHMDTNNIGHMKIPDRVPKWLEEVKTVKDDAQRILSMGYGCFNMRMRHRAGRNAFKTTEVIENLIKENSEMIWNDAQIPLGRVNSKIASASAPSEGDAQNHFILREGTFKDAVESLQQDHRSKVIALCGMGGVGKTTMLEQLKKIAEDKKMFDYIVKVVSGQQINMYSIQQAVAEYMGQSLNETSITTRADRLRITFRNLPEGRRKVLVILYDVWQDFELRDIGLSPFPNGLKLLLTSRNENICNKIAVEANLELKVVQVEVMEELEAQKFFCGITGDLYDLELKQIGSDIVRRCGGLPLAIKLIATILKSQKAFVWRDTLSRLKKNNLDYVQEITKISYNCIKQEEEKAIFLLCGLFPDDFNIPVEELTRYAWGLRLLCEVSCLRDARARIKTCVQNLKSANLLMDSGYLGCVKMHDLVLSFVLGRVSKGDHSWVINHGDISQWSISGMKESCKRISITCKGMREFPVDFQYPNTSLLRLMDGDKSLRFRQDPYEKMENLEVIAYEKFHYLLLLRSLQCATKLQTLIIKQCSLMFDFSAIGEHLNLEVLSFANCGIRKFPSATGKLKKLKLLDLTGCVHLRIDDGILKNLVNLEELYMRCGNGKAIKFTNGNCAELAELSEKFPALKVEYFDYNGKPENMFFTKLERFRIYMGRSLDDNTNLHHLLDNILILVTNKDDLLESRMNELFEKTEVLDLEVDGMNDLEEVLVEPVTLHRHSFNNLRVLKVVKCANLRYLFTLPMASGLMKLERLTVSQCHVLEVLVNSKNGGHGVFKFPGLKFLYLDKLSELLGFSNTVNVIELPELMMMTLEGLSNFSSIYAENTSETSPMSSNISSDQSFFNKEVLIPKLDILEIKLMHKLKGIWPHQVTSSDEVDACMLRHIKVSYCNNIVNLFPTNPMWLLRHLENLDVDGCGSIEVLFNIDMGFSSNLRYIHLYHFGKLRELWRMKGESGFDLIIRSFQVVERIIINGCESFENIFTPTVTGSSDVRTFMNVSIYGRRIPWEESRRNSKLVHKIQYGM